jgi:hypothetical protein
MSFQKIAGTSLSFDEDFFKGIGIKPESSKHLAIETKDFLSKQFDKFKKCGKSVEETV